MGKPELKQFSGLTEADFQAHPVWVGCHTADQDEPWYEGTDEETFRPWSDALPADPSETMLLVKATIRFQDGSEHPGFMTPALEEDDIGTMQPHIFAGGWCFGFWGGLYGVSEANRNAFYKTVARGPDQIFPIHFASEPGFAEGVTSGVAEGFYKMVDGRDIDVER